MGTTLPFLRVDKTKIVDGAGRPVRLRGVSLGGWLLMEGYMYCGRNIPEKTFRASFEKALGKEALEDFTRSFRESFIREEDIVTIKKWGANCVRIPFNYRSVEFEDRPFSFNEEGLAVLDRVVKWCEKHGLYCILDMHAVPGAQNTDWHADCDGRPEFFANEFHRERYLRLWHFLADHYKDVSVVAGYDVINEPLLAFEHEFVLKDLYAKVTKEIRDTDKKHIIFLEGNFWAQRLAFLGRPFDDNTAYSIHAYPPPDYTFNWETDLFYPGKVYGVHWDRDKFEFLAKRERAFMDKVEAPLYIGEFGVNWRGGFFGEARWVKYAVSIFNKYDFHWTYWTYKTVANPVFPDGIYRYTRNPAWVNRKGPVTGWETFASLWHKEKGRMMSSWRTENFKRNDALLSVLKNYF